MWRGGNEVGLDAFVFCDCFERGVTRTAPSDEWLVFVTELGQRSTKAISPELQGAFAQWNSDRL